MKKIFFNDKFCRTAAVLAGTMTQMRRIMTGVLPEIKELRVVNNVCEYKDPYTNKWYKCNSKHQPKYKVGEAVAVAQPYRYLDGKSDKYLNEWSEIVACDGMNSAGYYNKMFVRAELMPHQIEITNIRVQRLQDISDQDCLSEGIISKWGAYEYLLGPNRCAGYSTPQKAYSSLIDNMCGKGTWAANPWAFCYTFKLVK